MISVYGNDISLAPPLRNARILCHNKKGTFQMKKQRAPWRKILYEKQDYPDNFSGPEFLQDLKKNVTARTYGFWESVRGSCVVMQEVSSVLVYVILFAFVFNEYLRWEFLLSGSVLCLLFGYLLIAFLERNIAQNATLLNVTRDLKMLAIFLGFGYGLGPVFQTLTDTISTDTIYATATVMFLLSLVFRDYGIDVFIVSSALSLNAAVFGAVCLISRLPTSNDAFSLLTLAVLMFALWPLFRWKLVETFRNADIFLTVGLAVVVTGGLLSLSVVSALIYISLHAFVSFICPFWLMKMQPLKSTIHGPWDEAIISDQR